MNDVLDQTDHRPWPLPAGRWVMRQSWHNLLFAHWPVDPSVIAPKIPPGIELDLFDGRAWIGVVPFYMTGVRPRLAPAVPGLSNFPELNVRTYVKAADKPGVYFFSLDAHQSLAVSIARRWFHLPYYRARMSCEDLEAGGVDYTSERTHANAPDASLIARYRPTGPVEYARAGSLEHFLTERYCLYTAGLPGAPRPWQRGEIHHRPWPLQAAEAEFESNTMARAAGIDLPDEEPHLLFARKLDVCVWPLRGVEARVGREDPEKAPLAFAQGAV